MAVRTRRLSIIQHPPIFNKQTQNLLLFPAIIFALLNAILLLYIPALKTILHTASVPAEYFFISMTFGLGVLILDELRKYAVRRWPKRFFAMIAW
jgi:sodium/potassium-transporting ATPase subunit alpha